MIIDGDLPAYFVWKDEHCVAFLSINPLVAGHTLVVPREEIDHWLDLAPDLLAHLTQVSQKIGAVLMAEFSPVKVGVMLAGLEVPHVHIHLVPMRTVHDLDFANAEADPDHDRLVATSERIRTALGAAGHVEAAN